MTDMIRITIELLKHGDPDDVEIIGSASIWNDGKGTKVIGNYNYLLRRKGARMYRGGNIYNFARTTHNVWDLLLLVLKDAVGKKRIK